MDRPSRPAVFARGEEGSSVQIGTFRGVVIGGALASLLGIEGAIRTGAAQAPTLPVQGTRIRVVFPASAAQPVRYLPGLFIRLEGDTVVIATGRLFEKEQRISLAEGAYLERLIGSHGRGGRGALLGAVGGGVLGAVIGAATWKPCTGDGWSCPMGSEQGWQTAGGAMVGAAGGALVGLAIGSSIRTEEWAPVGLPKIEVALVRGGFAVSIPF